MSRLCGGEPFRPYGVKLTISRVQSFISNRGLFLTVAKCLISVSLIYWILQKAPLGEIIIAMDSANFSLLIPALCLNFLGYYISSHRWSVLLKVQGVESTIPFLIKSFMVGTFFNNFLPSTIGGDIVRAHDSWRLGTTKSGAIAVMVVDRVLGALSMLLVALSAMVASDTFPINIPFFIFWIILGTSGMALLVWAIFMPPPWLTTLVEYVGLQFPGSLKGIIEKIIYSSKAFQGRQDALAKALVFSLMLQANVVLHHILIAQSLSLEIPLASFFLIIPLSILIMMIPVSINAIGVRESVFVFFFGIYGISQVEAVAFSWLLYGLLLIQGLIGGMVYAFRRNSLS